MRFLAFLAAMLAAQAASVPKIYFTKDFPGSTPPYVAITVDRNGDAEFRDSQDPDQPPLRFRLEPSETEAIFSLAAKLDYFSYPLETKRKVAFTGNKTFRYEDGQTSREVKFNYSENQDAQALAEWFQRIADTSMFNITLERTARYDRLGLDRVLLNLHIAAENNRLAGASQLLPILDRIANNPSAFNRARERAAALAGFIRARSAAAN